ncbi:MAG: sugar-binding transcriptional regulator [Anaerolineales bacterium]|nr:MAG: sugar-binding transcriptional regulator [Anaerolineales bacterium]
MEKKTLRDRSSFLADVAEMYYLEEQNQAKIAKTIGLTRSMVSRMLTEARENGIVEIRIQRPLQFDPELESMLKEKFGLKDAFVVVTHHRSGERLTRILGNAGAQMLARYLGPKKILGLAWGTSISATVDAFEARETMPVKVVQLVGAMGARIMEYDGHDLVTRITEKLGGEAYYLNAPYLCQSPEIAKSLLETKSIRETIAMGKKTDLALLGIGTTSPDFSSFYLAGYVTRRELDELRKAGAIGDVCGLHFDVNGQAACNDFCERLVSIRSQDLLGIPVRLAVAGGEGKADAILGALRSKYVNVLVCDSKTARKVLELAKTK